MNFKPAILIIRKAVPYVASSLLGAVVHRIKFPRRKAVEVSVQGSAEFDTPEGRVAVRMGDDLRDPGYNPHAHHGSHDHCHHHRPHHRDPARNQSAHRSPYEDLADFGDAWPGVPGHA